MLSKKKFSILTLFFNYLNKIFLIIQGVILVPIYLDHFPLEVYGAWLATGNIVGILGMLEGGMNMVYSQKLSSLYGQNKLRDFSLIETSGLFVTLIILFFFMSIGFILAPFIPGWTRVDFIYHSDIRVAFIIASFAAGFGILKQNLGAIIGSWLEAAPNGISNIIATIFGIGAILFSLYNNMGVISIPIGSLVDGIIGSLYRSIYIFKKNKKNNFPKLNLSLKNVNNLVKDTTPITISNIGSSIVNQSQYLIIANFLNPSASAIYGITIKLFTTISAVISPIASSLFNSVAYFDIKKDLKKIKNIFNQTLVLHGSISIVTFGSILASNKIFISLWVGSDKYGGDLLTVLSFFAFFFSYRFSFINTFFLALGFVKKNAISNVLEISLRMLLIIILIKYLGYLSFPIAQIISTIVVMVLLYQKIISLSFTMKINQSIQLIFVNTFLLIITSILAIIPLLYFPLINNWFSLIIFVSTFLFLFSTISMILSKIIRSEAINIIHQIKQKIIYAK